LDNKGQTALICAAIYEQTACVERLLEARANLAVRALNGRNALDWAAITGHASCVQLLLDAKADIEAKNSSGMTALHYALYSDSTACAQLLLAAKADFTVKDAEGVAHVDVAKTRGHCNIFAVTDHAKEFASDPDFAKFVGATLLIMALAYFVHPGILCLLAAVLHGILCEYPQLGSKLSNLWDGFLRQLVVCVTALQRCIKRLRRDPSGALLLATRRNDVAEAARLLNSNANVKACNDRGMSALMLAAMHPGDRNKQLVALLVDARANVNQGDLQGKTPLMVAAYHSNHAAVERLLAAKARVNAADERGNTALLLAARHGATRIVKRLLAARANVKARDKHGKTALYWALQFGDASNVNALRATGAKD